MKKLLMLIFAIGILMPGANAADKGADKLPDVSASMGYAAEVNALVEGGIIQGDDNGNFRPNDTITRAEIAVVLCRAMGTEERAQTDDMRNRGYFEDVSPEHWAAGYINTAYDVGAVNGVREGIFEPDVFVTNEQLIKILVAAWGYTQEAEQLGGYPDGYMEVADKYGVLDRVSFNYGTVSKRWVASVFVHEVLTKLPAADDTVQPPLQPAEPSKDKTDTKKEPIHESRDEYVDDPVAVLKKVTPRSAKYENTVFLQNTSKSALPFEIRDGRIYYKNAVDGIYAGFQINIPDSKEPSLATGRFEYDGQSFDLSMLPEGVWRFAGAMIDGAVRDGYTCDFTVSGGNMEFAGRCFRSTTLNTQRHITEIRNTLTLSNDMVSDLQHFGLKTVSVKNDDFVLYISYPNALEAGYALNCSLVELDVEETFHTRVEGAGQVIQPVVVEKLKLNTKYFLQVAALSEHIDGIHLRGEITFSQKDGAVDFLFNGDATEHILEKYEILDYTIE